MDHHLTEQARQLSRSMHNRERRRFHADSVLESGDNHDEKPRKRRSEPLKAAREAYAAALAAAELQQQQTCQRCELCQASFTTEAQLQQHMAGPVHKKAEKKAAEAAAKRAHQSQYGSLAADALQAAAWHDSKSARTLQPAVGQQHQRTQQQWQFGHKNKCQSNAQVQQLQQQHKEVLTHEQMLAAVRQSDLLSLDGWVPPTIPGAPKPQHTSSTTPKSDNDATSDAGTIHHQQHKQQQERKSCDKSTQQQLRQKHDQDLDRLLPGYGGSSSEESEAEQEEKEVIVHNTNEQQEQDGQLLSEQPIVAGAAASGIDSGDDSSDESPSSDGEGTGHIVTFF